MSEEAKRIIEVMEMLNKCRDTPCYKCKMLNFKGEKACDIEDVVYQSAIDLIESLSEQLEQVTRERDAAIEELSYARKCSICKKHLSEGGDCYGNHKCGNGNPDWQWRGVEVEQ